MKPEPGPGGPAPGGGGCEPASAERRRPAIAALSGPLFVCLEVTSRCSCACAGCYSRAAGTASDLPAGEFRALLAELRRLDPAKVTLTGGEPGEDKTRLHEAIAALDDRPAGRRLGLMTNGLHLDRADLAGFAGAVAWINLNLTPVLAEPASAGGGDDLPDRLLARLPLLAAAAAAAVPLDLSAVAGPTTPARVAGLCRLAHAVRARSLSLLAPHGDAAPVVARAELVEALARSQDVYRARFIDPARHIRRMRATASPNAEWYIQADGRLRVSPFLPAAGAVRFRPGGLQEQWAAGFARCWEADAAEVAHA